MGGVSSPGSGGSGPQQQPRHRAQTTPPTINTTNSSSSSSTRPPGQHGRPPSNSLTANLNMSQQEKQTTEIRSEHSLSPQWCQSSYQDFTQLTPQLHNTVRLLNS